MMCYVSAEEFVTKWVGTAQVENGRRLGQAGWDKNRCVKLTTLLHLQLQLRIYGAIPPSPSSGVPTIFFGGEGGEVQQVQLRTECRENGDLGAVAPKSGVPLNLQMSETRILLGCYGFIFHGSRNLVQLEPPTPPRYATVSFHTPTTETCLLTQTCLLTHPRH
jgi:hypothetical protein